MKKLNKLLSAVLAAALFCCCSAFPAFAEKKLRSEITYGEKLTYLTLIPSDEGNPVYYTVNGSVPDTDSNLYVGRIRFEEPMLITAGEFDKDGKMLSSLSVQVKLKCAGVKLKAEKSGGKYKITLTSDTEGCTIYYTTDGSKPNKKSSVYKKPFNVKKGTVIRAYAVKSGMTDGDRVKKTVTAETDPEKGDTYGLSETELTMLKLINDYREDNGLSPLALDKTLCKTAKIRAKEIVGLYDHVRPDGTYFFAILKEKGYMYALAAENIAWGEGEKSTPAHISDSWFNSVVHRTNILTSEFEYTGISAVRSGKKVYWVQLFAKKKG